MAVVVKTKTGKKHTLLNPAEKGRKYAAEIRTGAALTNDGEFKKNKDGSYKGLTKVQQAYRGGYLDARKDSARAYKAKKRKRAAAKKTTKK